MLGIFKGKLSESNLATKKMMYLSLVLLASAVAADRYQFKVESSNDNFNGMYLYANKEARSGNDYVYLHNQGIGLEYDEDEHSLEGWDLKLATLGQYVVMASRGDGQSEVLIENDYLQLGSKTWGCGVTQDPNGYERSNLVYANETQPFDDCSEVRFHAEKLDDDSSSSVPPISLPSPIPSDDTSSSIPPISLPSPIPSDDTSSIPPISLPSPLPTPSGGWNTTTTTLTDITTYCPTETTITITTCGPHTCEPTTITVSEPTTVTVSSCIPEEPTHGPTGGTSTVLPTSVSSWEAAGVKLTPVFGGLAGLIALLV